MSKLTLAMNNPVGCVIPRAGAVARSRNLGQALFGSPVLFSSTSSDGDGGVPVVTDIVPEEEMRSLVTGDENRQNSEVTLIF